ncbi:MAG: shikimate dehydrogenase family protein [Qipengyuania sp.]
MTAYAEVIGDPIDQSKSPAIHNFWLGKLRIPAEYRACHVASDGLDEYLATRRSDRSWRGCNVTMPHKEALLCRSRLDGVVARAAVVKAVNTVVKGRSGLTGNNTDWAGFLEPLEPLIGQPHLFRMARIIGTGGAARAIVSALHHHGFTLVLAGRNTEKAERLLDELAHSGEHHSVPLDYFAAPTDFAFDDRQGCFDLVVNASPLGMTGQPPLAFDWSHAPPGSIAYDVVTDPAETEFLRNARASGFATIDGLAMLIGQAALSFELFFGQPAPRQHDAELRELLMQ